jgi:hypothetical protein
VGCPASRSPGKSCFKKNPAGRHATAGFCVRTLKGQTFATPRGRGPLSAASCEPPQRPGERQWLWTLAFGHHEDRTPTHGYEATREGARWQLLQNHGDGNRSYGKGNDEAQRKDRVIPVLCRDWDRSRRAWHPRACDALVRYGRNAQAHGK